MTALVRRILGPAVAGLGLLLLSGCGIWMGDKEAAPLEGDRKSALQLETDLRPDPRVAGTPVTLPKPYRNASWSQVGGGSLHAVGHVEGPAELKKPAWKADIGAAAGKYRPLLSEPLVARDRVFTVDSKYRVSAFETENGKRLWRTSLKTPGRDGEAFGGGIAYDSGRVYLSTGYAVVVALDAETGAELWRKTVPGPVRAAPLALDGQVYVVTVDNQMVALDAETGDRRWRHAGFAESAALLGSASPAGLDGVVIVPYSSGEIFALRAVNGRPTWSDNLAAVRRADAASALADIRALPVTDGSHVYSISHSGRMVAIDLRTGARVWERNIGGVRTPWLAGDWMFLVNNAAQVICISRRDGRIRWIAQLDRYKDAKDREGPFQWIGPMAVSGQLLVIGAHGRAVTMDPADGTIIEKFKIPKKVVSAAIAGGTLYLQTEGAKLLAYR